MKKRFLALMLSLVMIGSMVPGKVTAQGTKTRVYTVVLYDMNVVHGSRPMEYQTKVVENFFKRVTGFNNESYMMLLSIDASRYTDSYRYTGYRGFLNNIGDVRKTLDLDFGVIGSTGSGYLKARDILESIYPEPGVKTIKNVVLFSGGEDVEEDALRVLYGYLPKDTYTYSIGCPLGSGPQKFNREKRLKNLQNSGYFSVTGVVDHDEAFEKVANAIAKTYAEQQAPEVVPSERPDTPTPVKPTPVMPSPGKSIDKKKTYIYGYPDGTFRPNSNVTRAEAVSMIGRLLEGGEGSSLQTFKDVPSNFWATYDINRAYNAGILKEKRGEAFRPNDKITRAELAFILAHEVKPQERSVTTSFTDTRNHWALNSIQRLASSQVVKGYPDGTFRPDSYVTRAELVKMLNNTFSLSGAVDIHTTTSPFKDVPKSHWAYADILIASGKY